MFCQKCGKENSDDATFCNSCGASLTKKSTLTDAAPNNIKNIKIANTINEEGLKNFKQGDFAEAFNFFDKALRYNPNNRTIRNNRETAKKKLELSKRLGSLIKGIASAIWGIIIIWVMYTIPFFNFGGSQYASPLSTLVSQCDNPITYLLWGSVCQKFTIIFYIGWIIGIILIAWGILSNTYIKK